MKMPKLAIQTILFLKAKNEFSLSIYRQRSLLIPMMQHRLFNTIASFIDYSHPATRFVGNKISGGKAMQRVAGLRPVVATASRSDLYYL